MLSKLLFGLILMLAALPCSAATYYVDAAAGGDDNPGTSAGAPWKTLAKANASVMPGDTVIVAAGVYAGSIIAPANSGAADARITYAAAEGAVPEVTGGAFGSIVNLHDRSYVTVKGFKIHSPAEHDWVVNMSGANCTYNRIENCDVSDPEGYAPVVMNEGASYNEVVGCTVHDTGHADEQSGDCIVINTGGHHNTVKDNKCFNGCHSQVLVLNGSHDNVISGNDLYATDRAWAGAGVNVVREADNNTITANRIHDLGFATDQKCAVQVDSAGNTIARNVIYNVGAFGISLQAMEFRGQPQAAKNNLVANNTVYSTGRQGIMIVSKKTFIAADNTFVNNIVVGSPADWYGKPAWTMVFDVYHLTETPAPGAWFGNVFKNNLLFHRTPGEPDMILYNFKGGLKTWSIPDAEKEFPASFAGNIEADPKFAAPDKGDFSLAPASPAIGKGADTSLGPSPDIGAVSAHVTTPASGPEPIERRETQGSAP